MTGLDRAPCLTRPADWWDLGDGGNRLAAALCRLACPALEVCGRGDPTPDGVVRAGQAWVEGRPAAVCACGRPMPRPRVSSTSCMACDPPHSVPLPSPTSGRAAPGSVERHVDTIAALAAEGWTDRAVAVRLGVPVTGVRGVRRRHKIPSCAPQAGARRCA